MTEFNYGEDILCIYHGGCTDGFGSAFALWLWGEKCKDEGQARKIEYFPGVYQKPAPMHLCVDKHVYLVDFSYPPDVVKEIAKIARKVTIIDHHISAMKQWADIVAPVGIAKFGSDNFTLIHPIDNIHLHFDMRMSGAMLTWNYFNREPSPMMFRYIQDRDLWLFEYKGTKDYIMALNSYPQEFSVWWNLLGCEDKLINEGAAIQRWFMQYVQVYKNNAKRTYICGFKVPCVNANYCFASELAGELAKNEPFAASYFYDGTRWNFSLRSREGGEDVSLIAKQFGGGGHKNAAGFAMSDDAFREFIL